MRSRCPCCGSSREPKGVLPPDRLAPDGPGIGLIACTGCGTLESELPGDSPLRAAAPARYFPHQRPTGLMGRLTRLSQRRKVSLSRPWSSGGDVVDLGCGSGGFLEAWRDSDPGASAIGLEASSPALELARRSGLEIIEGDLEEGVPTALRGASLYTLWHVLEHLEDPLAVIRSVTGGIGETGRIVIAVPNASAFERSLFGDRTISWDPPRHRWHFTPEGLTALAGLSGLRVLDRFSLLSDDIYDAVASLQGILYPWSWVDGGSLRSRLAAVLAIAGGVPAGSLMAALNPWRQRASLGVVLGRGD